MRYSMKKNAFKTQLAYEEYKILTLANQVLTSGLSSDEIEHLYHIAKRMCFSIGISNDRYTDIAGLIGDVFKIYIEEHGGNIDEQFKY